MNKIAVIGIVGNSVFLPVNEFHVGGETLEASSIHFEFGGKGFNQAVAAARCGAEVSFLAAVGKEYRAEIANFLDKENIRHTLVFKDESTAFAAIVTNQAGSNHVTVYQGAQLSSEDVNKYEAEIKNADILLLNNEVDEAVNIKAIEIAKRHGVKCVLNPAPARKSHSFILDNIDLFTPNEHETLGIEDRKNVVMTLGKRGCLIKATEQIIPAVDSGKVVDTTGAGDTFNGSLAAMLASGFDIAHSATVANKISSVGVTRKYAVSSIPTRKEIEKLQKEQKMDKSKYVEDGFAEAKFRGDLKKVLLIGDSIREGYCPYVKEYLQDEFEVAYPDKNCRNTQYVLTSLKSWSGMFEDLNKVVLVTFNCGHWDIAHWNGDKESLTTEQDYVRNLKRIVKQLRSFFPLAKIVFFTTTPLSKNCKGMTNPRTNEEVRRYNKLAIEGLCDEVIVKDLYKVVESFGEECYKDYAHLTDEYNQQLGRYITEIILSVINEA